MQSDSPFVKEFKLSITKALADQLESTLTTIETAPLTHRYLATIENRAGVYELFVENNEGRTRVYVGKSNRDLRSRLTQHMQKISGRLNIELSEIYFKAVYVDEDLDAAAPEKMLIDRYRKNGSVPWNTNGFGNKDPGKNRDSTVVKSKHFDAVHPINLDIVPSIDLGEVMGQSVKSVLDALKQRTPYLIRYQKHPDISGPFNLLVSQEKPTTVSDWLGAVIQCLPDGWQATALPGYVIIYRELVNYQSAMKYWFKSNGVQMARETTPTLEFGTNPEEETTDPV